MNVKDGADYVKHILNKHDGEVRHWGSRRWTMVPNEHVEKLVNVKFWHYQFAKTSDARRFLYSLFQKKWDGDLLPEEIDWVLQQEGGETTLLKREGGGSASGERGAVASSETGFPPQAAVAAQEEIYTTCLIRPKGEGRSACVISPAPWRRTGAPYP